MARITALSYILPVRDLDAASRFYCSAFELQEVFRNEGIVFVGVPGGESAIGLCSIRSTRAPGPRTSAST